MEELVATLLGPHSGHFRMVATYWDMAASFVVNGAIDAKMFDDANAEHWGVFAKVQPFLPRLRELYMNPRFMRHLEDVCRAVPDCTARLEAIRERNQKLAARRAAAASKS